MDTHKRVGVVVAVGTLLILAGFLGWKSHKDFKNTIVVSTQHLLLNTAKSEAKSIEAFVSDIQGDIDFVAGDIRVQNAAAGNKTYEDVINTEGYSILEAAYKHLVGKVHGLYRLDSKGIIQSRMPWDATRLGGDYSSKPGVKTVMETHKPFVSELFLSNSGKKCFSVCTPIFKNEQFVGLIRAAVHLSTIQEMVKQIKVGKKGYVQIIDDDGWLLAHPITEHVGKDMIAKRKKAFPYDDWFELEDVLKKMKSGKTGMATYHSAWWQDNEPSIVNKLTAFAPIRLGNDLWSLGTVMSYDEVSGPVEVHTKKIVSSSVLVMLVFLISGIWYYRILKERVVLVNEARSAKKLQISDLRLNMVCKASGAVVWDWNIITDGLDWSNEYYRAFGYSEDDTLPTLESWSNFIHPDDVEGVLTSLDKVVNSDETRWTAEYRFKRKDGSYVYILDWGTVIHDKKGKSVRMIGAMLDITEQKKIEEKLAEYQDKLKGLTWKLSRTEEQERKRIATWIHEEMTQALVAVNMRLSALQNCIKPGNVTVDIDGFKKYISELIEKTRTQAFDLSSPLLHMFGLEEALRGYLADEIEAKYDVSTEFKDDGTEKPLDEDVKVHLYRSVRELLTNAIKHAQAKNIKVSMCRKNGRIKVIVEDDGIGFDSSANIAESDFTKGFGLFSIRENLSHLGGDTEVKSTVGEGTAVVLTAPLR